MDYKLKGEPLDEKAKLWWLLVINESCWWHWSFQVPADNGLEAGDSDNKQLFFLISQFLGKFLKIFGTFYDDVQEDFALEVVIMGLFWPFHLALEKISVVSYLDTLNRLRQAESSHEQQDART